MAPVSVVKVGTSSIAKETGELDDAALTKLAAELDGDVAGAGDGTKVRTLAGVVRELAGVGG